jgi:cytochrome c oxidase subunit II
VSLRRARSKEVCLKRQVIVILLVIGATSAAVWARQVRGGGDVKTIDVTASRFQFEPATISVAQGESVRLRLHSADRSHAFAIKAFRVKALIPKGGETVTVEFVADQAGTFAFTCSEYCGTGHSGMRGTLVVLAKER